MKKADQVCTIDATVKTQRPYSPSVTHAMKIVVGVAWGAISSGGIAVIGFGASPGLSPILWLPLVFVLGLPMMVAFVACQLFISLTGFYQMLEPVYLLPLSAACGVGFVYGITWTIDLVRRRTRHSRRRPCHPFEP